MIAGLLSALLSPWTLVTVVAAYFLYRRLMKPFAFFAERGVECQQPYPVVGNFGRLMLKKENVLDLVLNAYRAFASKSFFGIYDFSRPLFVIRDPELIRLITVKDFEHFLDHRPFVLDPEREPLFGKSLFMLTGQRWRDMRATLSPAFTGSKMRQMFQLVVECADQASQMLLLEATASRKPFVPEMKDLFTRFTNDVIATAAFGVQVNSLRDRDNEFYMCGKEATNFNSKTMMAKMTLISIWPRLASRLGVRVFSERVRRFYHALVHDTIRHREREGIIRPDMIHLLMQARKGALQQETPATAADSKSAETAGFATVEEVRSDQLQGERKMRWDDDDVTAQCFLFFFAGFDTSSTLLCFAAQELMENEDVQRRLIAEVDEMRDQLAGQPLSYDALQQMKYLDMVVTETLRKWPPVVALDRECKKAYTLTDKSGHTVQLQKGDIIWLAAIGIHRDPQYYADPDRFDPERFSEERKAEIQPFTYMPFGSGPRNCIGSRFALMECKAFLYYLLSAFTFEVAQTSCVPLELDATNFVLQPKGGFNVHLKPRV